MPETQAKPTRLLMTQVLHTDTPTQEHMQHTETLSLPDTWTHPPGDTQ